MISQHTDPNFDTPIFERGWLERPATLRQMMNWAYHIHRSSPQMYTVLQKLPSPKLTAKALWHAYQNALPVERQTELAHEFNRAMHALKAYMDTPKPSKPTVGKAKDRFGEKQRRAEKKAAERAAKRALTSKPTLTPSGTLWEGLL